MKRGDSQIRLGGEDRGVEALEVPDLQDALHARGERDQLARLGRGLGDRLLDQHVRAGLEEVAGDREMRRRRRDDADRIDLAEQLAVVGERARAELGGHGRRAPRLRGSTTATSSQPAACAYFCAWKRPR